MKKLFFSICLSLAVLSCNSNGKTERCNYVEDTVKTVCHIQDKGEHSSEKDTLRAFINTNVDDIDMEILVKRGDKTVHTLPYNYPKDDDFTPNGERVDSCLMLDINFDGEKDLLVYLGQFGNQGVEYFDAFVWNAAKKAYTHNEDFKTIQNPNICSKYKCIISEARVSAAEYEYRQFEYTDGRFMKVAEMIQYWKGNIYPEVDRAVYEVHSIKENIWKKNLKYEQISDFWKYVILHY